MEKQNMTQTDSKVVLVTGAARRLGAATAALLHERGWRVLMHCRASRAEADALAATLNARRPDSCRVLPADLAQDAAVEGLAQAVLAAWSRVDALVNNASAFYPTPVGGTTTAQWDDLFASNARAPFFLAQALAPELRRRRGAIVNLIDIHATRPLRGHTVYCMAKAAHAMMTLALARELAPDVRVNAVAPGAILWPERPMSTQARERIVERVALKRPGTPEDIARTFAFLLFDATYITGQVLAVDGGLISYGF
jgi:pteridine reductase